MTVWTPRFSISALIANKLMGIEAARAVLAVSAIPPEIASELRRRARLRSTHYSTRIEGNRLTLAEAEKVIEKKRITFHGRERDVSEVQNYWNGLLRVEEWAEKKTPITEEMLCRLHAMVMKGKRSRSSPYRLAQNVVRDAATGAMIYLPPEAGDVPVLMKGLVRWIHYAERKLIPVPLIAGLAHYQFVTIHPFLDGNGRTARLLATLILFRNDYGLKGFFSLEEHHARDLEGYYDSLATHPHHNYYEGRATVELTGWLEYFTSVMAGVFGEVKEEALRPTEKGIPTEPAFLRQFDRRKRLIYGLFRNKENISSAEVARTLGISDRMARTLLKTWISEGWLLSVGAANKTRRYVLSEVYRQYIGNSKAYD